MIVELILGVVGMLCILVAFLFDEFWGDIINENTIAYNLLNIVGSGLLGYYGLTLQAWPFVVLNGVWFVAAVIKLGRIAYS